MTGLRERILDALPDWLTRRSTAAQLAESAQFRAEQRAVARRLDLFADAMINDVQTRSQRGHA